MGRRLDVFLGRTSKDNAKLKSFLSLAESRLAVLKSHRAVRVTNARDDVAQLLRLGHQDRALLRVEQVIKEQNMLDVYVMIESYCNLVSERSSLLENSRECPNELKEAISGLIFGTSRCGDLPELQDARHIFISKFGKDFVSAASQLRNGCRVDPKMIQKMSTRQPSLETRQRVLQEIAAEKGIELKSDHEISFHTSIVDQKMHETSLEETNNFSTEEIHIYKDVSEAAQAAFKSAATAAAAAKAAMELSKSDFQGKGFSGDRFVKSGEKRGEIEILSEEDYSSNSDNDEDVDVKEVKKNVYVEEKTKIGGKPKSFRTIKGF
ncbi:hypothetical protein LUZ60_006271 [Juncus effusus]|nr:hypothetical protein LUZ60_006271 [Juncus effusus]